MPLWGNFELKLLTFLIPAYNSQAYLDHCISSMIVPELLDRLEILIVNDGSTDGTASIAEQYCARYPDTVRLITQPNRGHGGALNTGCAAARGKYLKAVDADDWVATENLPDFFNLLEGCDSDVVLTHHYTLDIGTGQRKKWQSFPAKFGIRYTLDEIMADWKGFDRSLTFHGITYKTAFYRRYGIQLSEHVFYEDHEYAAFPCCYARSVTPYDLFVYVYRIGDVQQSVSQANQLKRIGHTETVLRHMIQTYGGLTCGESGRAYAAAKAQGLLLSYLTTALLVEPNRKLGRQLAAQRMREFQAGIPEAGKTARRKYQVFLWMNRLHIGKQTWDRVLHSRAYNRLRRNHSFE